MANEEIEKVDSEITTETGEVQLTVDDYRKLEAEKIELEEKNKKLYARLKKEEAAKPTPLVDANTSQVNQELIRLRLKVDHGISDPDAIDFIMKNGGEKAMENPYVKGAVETIMQQKKAEQAVVAEDSDKSDIMKKHTVQELKNMPSTELEKILPHA